ncbi:SLATT domain-containing protein [Streptomyces montanus]|uniref:SLATT domain-containing protein n=1 Tax=Streptomyces montanus TaxID=2580423 RepID=A0A5R9FPA6_9ACTN|nr:SLATT domain-containing protein [Streptomyces montanus]TLS43956.1 SLATT domain-containing protein [Streptomyces montanus]
MSQPEMQPEGSAQDGRGDGRGDSRGDSRGDGRGDSLSDGGPGDLMGRPFPHGDWGEPAERLHELYRWVEAGALSTVAWYLGDRVWKRRAARVLRAGATAGVAVGAALPLLDLTGVVGGVAPWGYLGLLLGVACVGVDRFFGVTSGWMRDVATAQAVQRRLQTLQFDWASECVREVLGPTEGTAGEAAERCLGVLRRFSEDVTELVRAETAEWMVEFRTRSAQLALQSAGGGGSRAEAAPPGRTSLPPGARPNMPRQRPPEPR